MDSKERGDAGAIPLGECKNGKAEHGQHVWTEDDPGLGLLGGRQFMCLGWPLPAWARGSESEDDRTARNASTANLEAARQELLEAAAAVLALDSSEEAQASDKVPGDPKEGSMSSAIAGKIRDARKALSTIYAERPNLQTPEAQEKWSTAASFLAAIVEDYNTDYESGLQREQVAAQRASEWEVERERLLQQQRELTGRVESAANRNKPLMEENRRLQKELTMAKERELLSLWKPEDAAVGNLLLDCREAAEWLKSLSEGKPGTPIPQDNFAKVASKVSQLEAWARTVGQQAAQHVHSINHQANRLAEQQDQIRELKRLAHQGGKLQKLKPINLGPKAKACHVCGSLVKKSRQKVHRMWHKAEADRFASMGSRIGHLQNTANRLPKANSLLQDDRNFGDTGR